MKLNPPKAHRSKFAKRGKHEMCSFGSCQTRFEFLSQFRKVRNAFECFVTQVQTHLPKTKRVWPMKINVICTVSDSTNCRPDTRAVSDSTTTRGYASATSPPAKKQQGNTPQTRPVVLYCTAYNTSLSTSSESE